MTELDIERERREFYEACEAHGVVRNDGPFDGWLLAKRAVLGSAEPVAWRHGIKGAYVVGQDKERMQKMYGQPLAPSFIAPPAPVSTEPDAWEMKKSTTRILVKTRQAMELGLANGHTARPLVYADASVSLSADAKDSERYRWLRDNPAAYPCYVIYPDSMNAVSPDNMDAIIDAAIAAKEAGK